MDQGLQVADLARNAQAHLALDSAGHEKLQLAGLTEADAERHLEPVRALTFDHDREAGSQRRKLLLERRAVEQRWKKPQLALLRSQSVERQFQGCGARAGAVDLEVRLDIDSFATRFDR